MQSTRRFESRAYDRPRGSQSLASGILTGILRVALLPVRLSIRYPRATFLALAGLLVEIFFHLRQFQLHPSNISLDPPFSRGCQEPRVDQPRENATILMLARNADLQGAIQSVLSLEAQFNHWYHYGYTFLNDVPWDDTFKDSISRVVSGPAEFATINSTQWGYPPFIDQTAATQSIARQGLTRVMYAGKESYHHMCRFNSGQFYDHPALQKYKWYWRIEPDVQFTCAIPYDPFVEMARAKKKYGYVMALWEIGDSCPTLFRKTADWKRKMGFTDTSLWISLFEASWAPLPFRYAMSWLKSRDWTGDAWSMCHFWSNFEIADMDWYRGKEYREYFDMLDRDGGFYFERWGDAPVHSLAAAMLLKPEEVHHFEDFGYIHENHQTCPGNAKGAQLPNSAALNGVSPYSSHAFEGDDEDRVGCRCKCSDFKEIINPECTSRIRESVEPKRWRPPRRVPIVISPYWGFGIR